MFSFLSLGTYKLTPIISDVFFRLVILVPLITPYTLSSHNEIKINLPNLNDMSEMMSISLSCFFNPLNQIKLKTIVVLDQICEVYTSFMATRSSYKGFLILLCLVTLKEIFIFIFLSSSFLACLSFILLFRRYIVVLQLLFIYLVVSYILIHV